MSIFDRFKRPPEEEPAAEARQAPAADAPAPEAPTPETPAPETPAPETTAPGVSAPETPAPEAAAPGVSAPEGPAPGVSALDAVSGALGETMPLPLAEIQEALAATAVPPEPPFQPSGPLAPERLTDPDDLPFLARRSMMTPDRHGDPMESMGNIFAVAMLLAVGFLVVSLSSFGLSALLGKGNVTIVKNPGTTGMERITKTNGVISRMRTTTQQAEGVGSAIGTVYKLENGEIVWVPGVPAAGRTTGAAPSTTTSGTYTPPAGSVLPDQSGLGGSTTVPVP